jgi:two-component system CheB/CheR fusion protein
MKIIPYRASENLVEGAVLTFTETTQVRELAALKTMCDYAASIVETVGEPLVILDEDFQVISANWAFYETFQVSKEGTEGQLLFDLGNRQWDIPELRRLLGEILPHNEKFEDFAVEHDFPDIGRKRMRLNARKIAQNQFAIRNPQLAMSSGFFSIRNSKFAIRN